jgi:hypothetical protein
LDGLLEEPIKQFAASFKTSGQTHRLFLIEK